MGGGVSSSLPEVMDRETARQLAGVQFNENQYNNSADTNDLLTKEQLLELAAERLMNPTKYNNAGRSTKLHDQSENTNLVKAADELSDCQIQDGDVTQVSDIDIAVDWNRMVYCINDYTDISIDKTTTGRGIFSSEWSAQSNN